MVKPISSSQRDSIVRPKRGLGGELGRFGGKEKALEQPEAGWLRLCMTLLGGAAAEPHFATPPFASLAPPRARPRSGPKHGRR